jgi:hypothetical protein
MGSSLDNNYELCGNADGCSLVIVLLVQDDALEVNGARGQDPADGLAAGLGAEAAAASR